MREGESSRRERSQRRADASRTEARRSRLWYETHVSASWSRDGRARARWIARLVALVLAIVSVASSVTIEPGCLLALGDSSTTDDDRAPCPCPLDCTSCAAVRAVPPTAPSCSALEPVVLRAEQEAPPIEADTPPSSPDPAEISHVPKA